MAKTADMQAMQRAKDMAKAGANRDQIWKESGWNVEGKPYFEISDEML